MHLHINFVILVHAQKHYIEHVKTPCLCMLTVASIPFSITVWCCSPVEAMTKPIIVLQECNIEEALDEDEPPPSKSSKDKKSNGPEKSPSLVFKITSKVPYKTVLKGISSFLVVVVVCQWLHPVSRMSSLSSF